MVVALAAMVIAIGGVAFATIPDSSGTIHGCYQKGVGSLRVVESAADCRTNETAISWNQEGRPGPAVGGVVTRIRGNLTVSDDSTHEIQLSDNSWNQGANQPQEILIEFAAEPACGGTLTFLLDGVTNGSNTHVISGGGYADGRSFSLPVLESGTARSHTLAATLRGSGCGGSTGRTLSVSMKADVIDFE
jgi:hypothetical protein